MLELGMVAVYEPCAISADRFHWAVQTTIEQYPDETMSYDRQRQIIIEQMLALMIPIGRC
jgi:hypothetical protein